MSVRNATGNPASGTMKRSAVGMLLGALVILLSSPASPQETVPSEPTKKGSAQERNDGSKEDREKEKRERARQLEMMKRAAAEYEIYRGQDRKTKLSLRTEPVLRWANPVREVFDGAVFIWTLDGRPEVAACLFNLSGMHHDEFQSLSNEPLIVERNEQEVWYPSEAGVSWQSLAEAPVPADSADARLLQMRSLARQFRAIQSGGPPREGRWELRLLSQPLYRYGKEDTEVLDGALFVFSQGTDPEVVLLLEARKSGSEFRWHYALGRMTSSSVSVTHQGDVVWNVPFLDWRRPVDPKEPYITFFPRIRVDPQGTGR